MFDLSGKVAVVTGGAKGIGESISKVFARQGAFVHILDIDAEKGNLAVKEIEAQSGAAKFHQCDIGSHEDVGAVFQKVYDISGSIAILVNNAAIAQIGNVEQTSFLDMDKMCAINIMGAYNCLHFCVPLMKKSGGGVILNMASVAAVVGLPDRFGYSMSKGAVYAMTTSIAKDYINDNIRCNAIGPGRVHTPFVDNYLEENYPENKREMFEKLSKTQPIGRMGRPDEIANLALYLCSDEAGFVTGSFYPIDGGFLTLNS
ncbi:SDR family NAD(P)-dependent oxidoreductase [Maribacter sp. 2-571]|uniref:SDR family NAD(P)-dependent oxidoreductase n=1 Tax=Maribacter sp. 2-571 TaxID=3417569 RepID=UPI003D3338C9